ncbi:MAG: O-antigen ligase family protein [Urechidicola sp.]|nr:O-antigen ligase family protein [Urechidicola sp.]
MLDINYKLANIKERLFLLGVFSLPIYQTINHWFFASFMVVSFILFFLDKKTFASLKSFKFLILAVGSFFILKIFGLYNAIDFKHGIKELTRTLTFLLYPIFILSFKTQIKDFSKFENKVFYALVYGSVVTAIICWTNVIVSLKPDDIAANTFFGWKKSGSYLTQILNLHPPYLGLLLVASIVFLFKEVFYTIQITNKKKYLNVSIAIFLLIFLFNITARNSLFFLVLLSFVFLIYTKRWKLLLVPVLSLIISIIVIVNHPSQYYRIKMYDMLGMSKNDEFKDKRFSRLAASWNVFKTNPIIGVGAGNVQKLRNEQYQLKNDTIALKKSLNAHNQLFEYLAKHGLIGGGIFIGVNLFFLGYLLRNKQYFYIILLSNVLIATLTESIFFRVLGIQFYAILISMGILAASAFQEK